MICKPFVLRPAPSIRLSHVEANRGDQVKGPGHRQGSKCDDHPTDIRHPKRLGSKPGQLVIEIECRGIMAKLPACCCQIAQPASQIKDAISRRGSPNFKQPQMIVCCCRCTAPITIFAQPVRMVPLAQRLQRRRLYLCNHFLGPR